MQFTPQQVAGAQRYGSQTRIGNWYEDERLAEARFASFTDKKERKLLASDYRRQKMGTCLQKVPLSFSEDDTVRYGAVIQLESAEVGGALACDPFEETSLGSQSYMATVCPSSPSSPPPARMAFKLVAVTDPRLRNRAAMVHACRDGIDTLPAAEGEQVRFGDLFHLVCDPGLRVSESANMRKPPLYLASALKTQSLSSRVSNKQAVFLKAGALSGTVWQFQKTTHGKDGSVERILGVGCPVFAGCEVVIQHRDTLMALSCERAHVEPTDFGAEFEVCCQNSTTNGKCLQLVGEQRGSKTSAAAAKAELRANRWLVRQGERETAESEAGRNLPPEMTADNLLEKVRGIVQERPAGLLCLRNALCSVDPSGRGKLDRDDARWCLHDFGATLDDEQSQILLDKYDRDSSGLIRIEELLSGLRKPLGDHRRSVVEGVFNTFAPDGHGKVNAKQLQGTFDAEATERALNGDAAPQMETLDMLRSGLAGLGICAASGGGVALSDFERFHQDLCLDGMEDDKFDGIVHAAWRIAGGGAD